MILCWCGERWWWSTCQSILYHHLMFSRNGTPSPVHASLFHLPAPIFDTLLNPLPSPHSPPGRSQHELQDQWIAKSAHTSLKVCATCNVNVQGQWKRFVDGPVPEVERAAIEGMIANAEAVERRQGILDAAATAVDTAATGGGRQDTQQGTQQGTQPGTQQSVWHAGGDGGGESKRDSGGDGEMGIIDPLGGTVVAKTIARSASNGVGISAAALAQMLEMGEEECARVVSDGIEGMESKCKTVQHMSTTLGSGAQHASGALGGGGGGSGRGGPGGGVNVIVFAAALRIASAMTMAEVS